MTALFSRCASCIDQVEAALIDLGVLRFPPSFWTYSSAYIYPYPYQLAKNAPLLLLLLIIRYLVSIIDANVAMIFWTRIDVQMANNAGSLMRGINLKVKVLLLLWKTCRAHGVFSTSIS